MPKEIGQAQLELGGGGAERYNGNSTAFAIGDVLKQTINDLPNGHYYVSFKAFENYSNWDDSANLAVGNNVAQVFANDNKYSINTIKNTGGRTFDDDSELYTLYAQVTDGTLVYGITNIAAGGNWAACKPISLTYLGESLPENTELTQYVISNWDFNKNTSNGDFLGWTISAPNGGNTWKNGDSNVEYWIETASNGSFDYYQTEEGLPEGRYTISASMWNTQIGTANGNAGVYGTSNGITAFAGVTIDSDNNSLNTYSTSIFVNNGELRLGVKNNGTMAARWFGVDWIKLTYMGKVVQDYAVELPDGGAMAADTWYYFDIAAAADNYLATATTLGDIICVTDANTLTSAAAGTVTLTATDNSFTAQRYYVKSSSANNLVVSVASYSYTIGTATQSIADGAYTNTDLTTVTFNFSEATTNDSDASFALLNNTAKAYLRKGGVEQAQGTLSLDGKVLTATFNTTLDLSSAYTIDIASGVVGYEGNETNAAINTTLNTGIIADGIYYFKKKGEYKYLTRGGNYGTETVVDNYGLSFEAAIQADGKYYLKNVDHSLSANAAKYLNTYTDGAAYGWTIATATGGYYLIDSDSKYLTAAAYDYTDDNSNTNTYYYQSRTSTEGEAIVWELLSKSEYATSLTAKKNAEIAALATAAGISASTLSEFESALSTDYGTTDMTSSISNPLCNSASGWTAVSYNGGSKYTAVDYHAPTIQVWNCTGGITQSISSLPEGLYKVTVSATWRPGNSVSATRVGNEANTTAWIYANDNITQMKGWYEGGGTINSTQDLIDNASSYVNTVYVYLDGTEDLKIGVAVPAFCVENWCPIYNWTLTRYEAKATTAEKTALANAIDTYDKIGFEDAEYAPYNNIEAIAALAAAKAIDPETASGAAVVAATTALTGATWTPNDGEQNAIYWEDYTAGDIAGDSYIHPLGWTNTGYNTRIYSEAAGNKDTNAGISAVNNLAMMFKYNTTYGETEGYTMPLKAATVYKITFKYCGWGNTPTTNIVLTDPESNAISLAPGFRPATNDGNTNASDWYEYTGYFASTTAGDYVLAFNKADGGQQQIGIGDMELVSATELPFADGSVPTYAPGTYPTVKITRTLTADRWATAVYPFAVSGVDNIAVLNSYDASTGALGFTSAAASTANVPFLMRSTAGTSEISLNDVAVAATSATDATANEASLKGVYASTDITSAEKNYVLSNNTIYPVGAAGATINPYRAYIQIAQDAPTRNLTFFVDGEEATAIENVSDEPSTANQYYDLSGRRVVKPTKGLYIVNGKKVMVK